MSELDTKIIDYLTENARLSFRRIAHQTDRSTDTIINHYNQMRDNGEIRGSTVVVDIDKIGYEGIAAFQIDASTSEDVNPGGIIQTLIEMPNIIVATKTAAARSLFYNLEDVHPKILKLFAAADCQGVCLTVHIA